MTLVIDASVAVKWVLSDRPGEYDTDKALALLLRVRQEISEPPGLFFCPSAALQKGLHIRDMRPFLRLAGGQNSCAVRLAYFLTNP